MAYGKFKKRTFNRKGYGKRKSFNSKSKSSVPNKMRFKPGPSYGIIPEPFPRTLKTQMKYAKIAAFTTNALQTAVSHTFRLNSIWDPDQSGIGTTVVGHSNMASIYDRYLVTGAKVDIRYYDPSSDAIRVGCRLRINGTNPTAGQTMTQLIEQPLTYQSGLAASGSQLKTFSLYVPIYTLLGISKLEYMANTTNYSSDINSNPLVDRAWLDLFVVEGTSTVRTVAYAIKIKYYVTLYDRKPLSST